MQYSQRPENDIRIKNLMELARNNGDKVTRMVPIITEDAMATVIIVPKGMKSPRMNHVDKNRIYLVAKGSGSVTIGDVKKDVRTGDLILVPKGLYQVYEAGDEMIMIVSMQDMEDRRQSLQV